VREGQQFFKFCQCLSAFTLVPAVREESTHQRGKKKTLPTKPALSAWPVGAGTGMAASLQVNVGHKPSPPAPLLPLLSSHSLFAVVRVLSFLFFFFPQSHFSSFYLDHSLKGKELLAARLPLGPSSPAA
jgi:hypothetical protein